MQKYGHSTNERGRIVHGNRKLFLYIGPFPAASALFWIRPRPGLLIYVEFPPPFRASYRDTLLLPSATTFPYSLITKLSNFRMETTLHCLRLRRYRQFFLLTLSCSFQSSGPPHCILRSYTRWDLSKFATKSNETMDTIKIGFIITEGPNKYSERMIHPVRATYIRRKVSSYQYGAPPSAGLRRKTGDLNREYYAALSALSHSKCFLRLMTLARPLRISMPSRVNFRGLDSYSFSEQIRNIRYDFLQVRGFTSKFGSGCIITIRTASASLGFLRRLLLRRLVFQHRVELFDDLIYRHVGPIRQTKKWARQSSWPYWVRKYLIVGRRLIAGY